MKTDTSIQTTLAGFWHNQHNSELFVEIDENGKIAGYFKTGTSRSEDESELFALTGFAKGDVFAFCVDFSKYGCMTSWVGQIMEPGDKSFQAMWQMVADSHHDEELSWKSTWIGQDCFTFGPRGSYVSRSKGPRSHPRYCGIV
jgi:hypothetical protein